MLLWLCNPHYIRDVVMPCVREGRERAGKPVDGFDVIAGVPGALTDDPQAAWDAMRRDLLPYLGLPFYRTRPSMTSTPSGPSRYWPTRAPGERTSPCVS